MGELDTGAKPKRPGCQPKEPKPQPEAELAGAKATRQEYTSNPKKPPLLKPAIAKAKASKKDVRAKQS